MLTEPRGGGGLYALTLARASAARGDSVAVVAPTRLSPEFEAIPLQLSGAASVVRALRGADIVHCHGIRAGVAGLIPTSAATVQTPNGVHQARSKRGVTGLAARAATGMILRPFDLVVCVSESEQDFVRSLVPTLAPRLRVVLNGVAARPMASTAERMAVRGSLGLKPDQPVLLFVGGLRYQKNPLLAIEAVRLARRKLPDLVLLVAGDGPLRAQVQAAAEPGVELLGDRQDVTRLLGAADAVVNTSRWEGLSLALLEALWAGRPLIVTDAPGNREAVGDAGFVVPMDGAALASAIVQLFTETDLLRELSERARARAALFSDTRMVSETLPLYDEARWLHGR